MYKPIYIENITTSYGNNKYRNSCDSSSNNKNGSIEINNNNINKNNTDNNNNTINNNNNNNNNNNKNRNDKDKISFDVYDIESIYTLKCSNSLVAKLLGNFMSYKWKNRHNNLLKLDLYTRSYNKVKTDMIDKSITYDSLYVNKNSMGTNKKKKRNDREREGRGRNSHENGHVDDDDDEDDDDDGDDNDDNDDAVDDDDDDDDDHAHLIYITPHIIFYNYENGSSTVDLINLNIIDNIDRICIMPKYIFRSHENKSIEFIRDSRCEFKNNRYVTLKAYCESCMVHGNNRYTYDIVNFQAFISSVENSFKENHLIPYFVHPQRLVIFRDDSLRLISPNLLQFIYSPFSRLKKIHHLTFSHPRVLTSFGQQQVPVTSLNGVTVKMMRNTVDLFLDFFHSSFVTALWIYNFNNSRSNDSLLVRNIYSVFNDYCYASSPFSFHNNNNNNNNNNKNKKRKKVIVSETVINETNYELNHILSQYSSCNTDPEVETDKGKAPINRTSRYGFCRGFHSDDTEIKNVVHNYGCIHLLSALPLGLDFSIQQANDDNCVDRFLRQVDAEFTIFLNFLDILKNIKHNNNGQHKASL